MKSPNNFKQCWHTGLPTYDFKCLFCFKYLKLKISDLFRLNIFHPSVHRCQRHHHHQFRLRRRNGELTKCWALVSWVPIGTPAFGYPISVVGIFTLAPENMTLEHPAFVHRMFFLIETKGFTASHVPPLKGKQHVDFENMQRWPEDPVATASNVQSLSLSVYFVYFQKMLDRKILCQSTNFWVSTFNFQIVSPPPFQKQTLSPFQLDARQSFLD